ncbi:MAG: DUF2189 domain-containing protein [Rhizobiales bacterium]|nr:DUF2189 domain-containing protein [Hyphomicrobiales bacterium]
MPKPSRISHPLSISDVFTALHAGWKDFMHAPLLGLFFGGIYAAGGILLYFLLSQYRSVWLILPLAIGFPLVGPFVAAGLYEISRRIAHKEPLNFADILTVTLRQSRREFGWMAFVVLFIMWVWMYQVRLLVALFMGFKGFASLDGFLTALTQSDGMTFLMVGSVVGAGLAFVLFCSTVISMPMLLHRDVDFITAVITSWRSVFENLPAMIFFGIVIAALTFLALIPMFLGLLIVLPVLGHATWHLYVASRHIEDRPA